jgi:SAM-dependent methyltransferase
MLIEEEPMAWEMNLLRKTKLGTHPYCLDTLGAYADIAPLWQRGCLFLYAGLGTWLAMQFGTDMAAMWRQGECLLQDMMAVTHLTPREIAEMLRRFVAVKLRDSRPLDFDRAKSAVYDQLFWPMAAHMAFALQPSAVARRDFVTLVASCIDREHAHVADLGCGPGAMLCSVLDRRPAWTGEGLDISQVAVDYAKRLAAHKKLQGRARFSTGDLSNLPYANGSFDLVVASEVLEHVPEIRKALGEIRRVVRPGGKIVITVPLHSRTALHVHSVTGQDDIAGLCRDGGLTVRHLESRQYPGFGDDWSHAFVVAEAGADGDRDSVLVRSERPLPALDPAYSCASQWR